MSQEYGEVSIGEALKEYDRINYEQRELEKDDRPAPDGLKFWTGSAHPDSECGDPASCSQHASAWQTHQSASVDMGKGAGQARLRTCKLDHGGSMNAASAYGHRGSVRVCIRLHGSDVWIFDPEWERLR